MRGARRGPPPRNNPLPCMKILPPQTMLRIRDPAPSLDFYTRALGMTLLAKLEFAEMAFTLYFLG